MIVNETFAKRFWPDAESALGKRVAGRSNKPRWMTVVGVARDVKHYGLDKETRPSVFLPHRQVPVTGMTVILRGSIDPAALFVERGCKPVDLAVGPRLFANPCEAELEPEPEPKAEL